ncbi:pentapeptide repeat-containing protein [Actinoplanes sp. NPDC024001]|uniref:pentapeptide repeat-containing protein n=1 Tax=Actinoplanes sp. NPDC024001 TaxID=3154598 RepID=UPI0033E09165
MTASVAPEPEQPPLVLANQRIRDTAKWLIASAAGVGAALIAGSQLSSIGRLDVGWPTSLATVRLWVAAAGALLALAAVVFAIAAAVRVLLPVQVLISDLAENWDTPTPQLRPVIAFLRRRPKFLQGTSSPGELISRRAGMVAQLGKPGADPRLRDRIESMDRRIEAVEDVASHEALKATFERCLRRLLVATLLAATGVVAFAWAANPPAKTVTADLRNAKLSGAFLRDADLRNAKLDGADLTGADLTGADLTGASLVKVTWSRTTCPDGSLSEENNNTCQGHLQPD